MQPTHMCFNTKNNRSVNAVLCVAIIVLMLFSLTPPIKAFDTAYYLLAGDNLWHGEIDCLRTPVYPLLLKICSLPWDGRGMEALMTILQSAVFLVSVWAFHDMLRRLIKRDVIVLLCSLYYAAIPAGWANEMLTESLSISLTVILTRELVCFLQGAGWRRALRISLLLTIMVFLRTNFIAFFAVIPLTIICDATNRHFVMDRTHKAGYWTVLLFLLIPAGSYLGYCKAYENKYGIFGASISTATTDIYCLRGSGAWDPGCVTNPAAKDLCLELDNTPDKSYRPVYYAIETTRRADLLKEACREMKTAHRQQFIKYKASVISLGMYEGILPAVNTHTWLSAILFFGSKTIAMRVYLVYLFTIAGCAALTVLAVRKRRIPVIASLLVMILLTQAAGISVAASDSLGRLFIILVPIMLAIMGWGGDKMMDSPILRYQHKL